MISDPNHPRIRPILRLQYRKEREKTGLFFVDGVRFVSEAIETRTGIETLVMVPTLLTSPFGLKIARRQKGAGIPCLEVTPEVFEDLSPSGGMQGIGAVVRQRWESLERVKPSDGLCWVALDSVQSPGNLGTIFRTCDAVGAAGVILIGHTTDPYDPSAVRASMGAIFSQRLVRTRFAEFAAWKKRHDCLIVGTSPKASADYRTVSYRCPVVLFMGSEQKGLSQEQQALCDLMVRIPMVGRSDSLNLGVATGVMLYEVFNQCHAPGKGKR